MDVESPVGIITQAQARHVWRLEGIRTGHGFADFTDRVQQFLVRGAPLIDGSLVAHVGGDAFGILDHWGDICGKQNYFRLKKSVDRPVPNERATY